jgi:PAS domain-containing protein
MFASHVGAVAPYPTAMNACFAHEEQPNEAAVLVLDDIGRIRDCDPACEAIFKWSRAELLWRHVSLLLPQLAEWELIRQGQIHPRLRFLTHIGHPFRVKAHDGEEFASELFFNVLDTRGLGRVLLIVRPITADALGTEDGRFEAEPVAIAEADDGCPR